MPLFDTLLMRLPPQRITKLAENFRSYAEIKPFRRSGENDVIVVAVKSLIFHSSVEIG